MSTPTQPTIDIAVTLPSGLRLPAMRITPQELALVPVLVEAQIRTAEYVIAALAEEEDEDVDG